MNCNCNFNFNYNHETMSLSRESFIAGETIQNGEIRPEILESWIRSRDFGIDPYSVVFSPFPVGEMKQIQEKWVYRRETNIQNVKRLYDLLIKSDSVIFYLDIDLNIWLQRGNVKTLELLNLKNLGIGSNLSENSIGTNAAAMTVLKKGPQCVVGAEHFIECLQDFASIACERYDEYSEKVSGYLVIFTPLNKFTPTMVLMLEFFAELTRATMSNVWSKTALHMTHEFLHLGFEQKDVGAIFVDSKGFMISSNSWVFDHLGISNQEIEGSSLKDKFPEFSELDCLHTGKAIGIHQVYLHAPINKNVYIECRPVRKEGSIIGMIINIHEKMRIQKIVNQVSNNSAYFTFEDLIGTSPSFMTTKEIAENASGSSSNVLIVGESGTGKELFAQAIHNASNRRDHPFVSINCAAIPRELIGSELFGYVEGAFTGARKNGALGKFEIADKGTLFLDEIGEMPIDMQSVLLRVLEEKRVVRLGGNNSTPIDVRIIAATNKSLWDSVSSKEFRLDLYYRLNVIKVEIPPLRDRKEDIPLLIEHLLKQFNTSLQKDISGYTPEAINILQNYNWPGNVRELRNVVERGVNLNESSVLTMNDLPKEIIPVHGIMHQQTEGFDGYEQKIVTKYTTELNKKKELLDLMAKYKGNKCRVAEELGISRVTLYKKLKEIDYSP